MPTLNKINLNGVTYNIGGSGSSNVLIVEGNMTTGKATYSAAEIKTAIDNGSLAYFYVNQFSALTEDPISFLLPIKYVDETEAQASLSSSYIDSNTNKEIGCIYTFCIDTNKNITYYLVDVATVDYVDEHDYNITYGTSNPSGGEDGDIYFNYEA